MQRPIAFTLLLVVAGLMSGCGGSGHTSLGAQRAAIAAAKRYPGGTRPSPHTSMFPTSPGTINCRIPTRTSGWYFAGRCTSRVWPHGSATEVSFIESGTALVGPTSATEPVSSTRRPGGGAGHETFLVDRHNQAHFVEISNWFPQNAP
jgi:hypothetical protein